MYIIDESVFNRDCMVANNNGIPSDGEPSLLTQLIDGRSRLFFKNLLGYELFKDLDSDIENGVLKTTAQDKWKNLINGVEYTQSDVLLNWQGIKYTEGAFTQSILRYFVYDGWLRATLSASTSLGQVVIESKNAVNVGSSQKVTTNWNKFVAMNQYKCNTPYARRSIVNGIEFIDWFGSSTNDYVSVIKFIQDHPEDYPNANCKFYEVQNQFGL